MQNDWKRAYNEMNEFEKELKDWVQSLLNSGYRSIRIHSWSVFRRDRIIRRNNGRSQMRTGETERNGMPMKWP